MFGVVNQQVEECFSVYSECSGFISGIDSTAFTSLIYDPTGTEVSGTVGNGFVDLGNGNYKYLFTPNSVGAWYVGVIHPQYFPWGKFDEVQVYTADLTMIYRDVIRTLGLSHSNVFIDQTQYDSFGNLIGARVRIYEDALSVGTNVNIIETYKIEVDASELGKFNYWKQLVT
jgi:hypothetical protein